MSHFLRIFVFKRFERQKQANMGKGGQCFGFDTNHGRFRAVLGNFRQMRKNMQKKAKRGSFRQKNQKIHLKAKNRLTNENKK
jgi:hypothetical protein